jgi:hypothetical protein
MFAAMVACFAVSSCSDSSIPVSPQNDATNLISGPTRMDVVTWDTPVTTAQSASAVIGFFGGQISLPSLGLTVTVPALAVTSPTTITVTAVPGTVVAYEFEPHGIQFNVPVIVSQSLSGTSASQSNGIIPGVLYGGYFADVSAISQLNATSLVDEILRVSIDRVLGSATFSVVHFSGYLLASGESGPVDGEGTH